MGVTLQQIAEAAGLKITGEAVHCGNQVQIVALAAASMEVDNQRHVLLGIGGGIKPASAENIQPGVHSIQSGGCFFRNLWLRIRNCSLFFREGLLH